MYQKNGEYYIVSYKLLKLEHNLLWQTFILDKFGSIENFLKIVKSKIMIKKPSKSALEIASAIKDSNDRLEVPNAEEESELKLKIKKKKEGIELATRKIEALTNLKNSNYSLYKAYRTLHDTMIRKKDKIKQKEEKRIQFKVLEKPQMIAEWIYMAFCPPLFFLCILATTILFPLYLDETIKKSYGTLFGILVPFFIALVPIFFITGIFSFIASYLRSLRLSKKMDTLLLLFFTGNLWIPLLPFLFYLKILILPETTSWRSIMAPSWCISVVYIILSLFVIRKFRLKFGTAEKLLWMYNAGLNLCICLTTGILSGKLDNSILVELGYLNFVFTPIWLLTLAMMVIIGIGGFFFLHKSGWKKTLFLYFPLTLNFVLPILPFFILLGLELDQIIQIRFIYIFFPLIYWASFWFVVSFIYSHIITIKIFCK